MIRSNIAVRASKPELIEFFYPNYIKLSEYSPFVEGGVIYDGESKYLQSFRDANIPYIYIKGTPEYDLTVPENLLNFVFDKWDKKPTKALVDLFKSKDSVTDEMIDIAKQVWVTGKYSVEDDVEERMNNLQKSLARGSTYDIIKEYVNLSSSIGNEKLFYLIQIFIKQSQHPESINSKKVWVKNNAEAFMSSRGKNIDNALNKYLYSPAENNEIKLLKLFDELTSIRR